MEWRKIISSGWVVGILIFAINFALKIATADYASLYLDEATSVFYAQQDWGALWEYASRDANPPLHFILLKCWISMFGVGEFSVRGLSVLFSSGAAVVLWFIVKRFASARAALVTVALFTLSSIHLHYAQEARGFALLVFLSTLSFWFYLRLFKDEHHKAAIGLLIVNVLLLMTHYSGMFVPLVQGIGLLAWKSKPKKVMLWFIGAQVLTLLLLLPEWLTINADKLGNNVKWFQPPDLSSFFEILSAFSPLDITPRGDFFLIIVGLGIGVGLAKSKKVTELPMVALVWFLGPLICSFILSHYVPMFTPKYMLYTSIGMFILAGLVFELKVLGKWWHLAVGGVLVVFVAFHFQWKQNKSEDWKGAIAWLEQNRGEADVLITRVYNYRAFAYHYDQEIFQDADSVVHRLYDQQIYCADKLDDKFFEYVFPDEMIVLRAHKKYLPPNEDPVDIVKKYYEQRSYQKLKGIEIFEFDKKILRERK